jgi:hypothetical protein
MKTRTRLILVLFLAGFVTGIYAQVGNVVVFAPKGEKFTLYIGSKLQNQEPAARVEADNPGGPNFKLKVSFPDPSIKEISKLVFNKPHETMYYKVGKNQKGVYVLESTSSEWMDETMTKQQDNTPPPAVEPSKPEKQESKPGEAVNNDPANSSKTKGCVNPLSEPDFNAQLVGISARPFEPMQLSAAKKMAETHCLMTSQVIRIIYIFDNESSRLSFAKFAYDFTYDRDNYEDVKEALHSEKSKTELGKYIAGKTK